jgi:hypothetical protein
MSRGNRNKYEFQHCLFPKGGDSALQRAIIKPQEKLTTTVNIENKVWQGGRVLFFLALSQY